jgi:hypothetical protein
MTSHGPLHTLLVAVLCCCTLAVALPDVIRIGQSDVVSRVCGGGVAWRYSDRAKGSGFEWRQEEGFISSPNIQTVHWGKAAGTWR